MGDATVLAMELCKVLRWKIHSRTLLVHALTSAVPKISTGSITRPQSLSNQEALEAGGSYERSECMCVACRSFW